MIVLTPRLRLSPVSEHDVDDLYRLDSDPAVMRYVSGGRPTPRRDIVDWVVPRAQAELAAHGTGLWVVRARRSGQFGGWVSLRTPRHSNRSELEISYRLARAWWGAGVATEATLGLVTMAFEQLPAQRLFASTLVTNTASRRVMQKLGMRLSAQHISDEQMTSGFAHGEVEYELMRMQWQTRRPRHALPTDMSDTVVIAAPPKHAQHPA